MSDKPVSIRELEKRVNSIGAWLERRLSAILTVRHERTEALREHNARMATLRQVCQSALAAIELQEEEGKTLIERGRALLARGESVLQAAADARRVDLPRLAALASELAEERAAVAAFWRARFATVQDGMTRRRRHELANAQRRLGERRAEQARRRATPALEITYGKGLPEDYGTPQPPPPAIDLSAIDLSAIDLSAIELEK